MRIGKAVWLIEIRLAGGVGVGVGVGSVGVGCRIEEGEVVLACLHSSKV